MSPDATMRSLFRLVAVLGVLALAFAIFAVGFPPRAAEIAGVAGAPGGAPIVGPVGHGDSIGTWKPEPDLRFQVQLGGEIARALGANVYDLDPFTTSTQTVAELRAGG